VVVVQFLPKALLPANVKPSKFVFSIIVPDIWLVTKESAACSLVNSVSKFLTSVSDLDAGGMNSGLYAFAATLEKSSVVKKGVRLSSLAPVGPEHSLSITLRSRSRRKVSLDWSDNTNLVCVKSGFSISQDKAGTSIGG